MDRRLLPTSKRRGGIKAIVERVYDNVHLALWAAFIAGLIFLGVFGIPKMYGAQALYQAERARQIEAEDGFYCRRWGMVRGGGKHRTCMTDLEQFRRGVEKRLADDSWF